jgi:hypothetical protein
MTRTRAAKSATGRKRGDQVSVDLALQGGGSHGAFTWGVLDRLLEESSLRFDGISGTSAGAMNAAVMASGLMQGGPEGAREALEGFWRHVSDAARMSPLRRGPIEILTGNWALEGRADHRDAVPLVCSRAQPEAETHTAQSERRDLKTALAKLPCLHAGMSLSRMHGRTLGRRPLNDWTA